MATRSKPRRGCDTPPQIIVADFLKLPANFDDHSVDACVLFADLVGSTQFKMGKSAIEGIARTVRHNDTIDRQIRANRGLVVKHTGDGVMGIFREQDCECQALKAGLEIITELEGINTKSKFAQDDPARIETRIGVHIGKVWMFRFPESNANDPQGTTVDIAARLAGLAQSQQLICTEGVYVAADGKNKFPNSSQMKLRFVKGVLGQLEVRMVRPVGLSVGEVGVAPHDPPVTPEVVGLLKSASSLREEKKYSNALDSYEEALRKTKRGNFEANYRIAEMIIEGKLEGKLSADPLKTAFDHLCAAKQLRDRHCRIWLLFSWIRFRWFEQDRDEQNLKRALDHAEKALAYASDDSDVDGITLAKRQISHLLVVRARQQSDDKKKVADLTRANQLCSEMKAAFDGELNRHKVDYLVTHAQVILALNNPINKRMLEDVDRMLKEAEQAAPKNPEVYLVRAEWAKQS
ncbi:MAG: adenylate/guanylate cyclase domain-containing protein [Phycisphaerales bacterium]|nr:adenylate/guanylate cyclase domain-containing protein [Phycisphaerales bacterium]